MIPESKPQIPELHGLVLAAGGSQRLGQFKQLLRIGDETLLHRVCRQAQDICPQVTVVLGAESALMTEAIIDLPLARIINPDWSSGMASSLRAGILALPATADAVLVLLCDQPAITEKHLQALVTHWQQQPDSIIAAAYAGIRGVPAIFPRARFPDLLSLSGDTGARALLNADALPVVGMDMAEARYDLDTDADIAVLEELLQTPVTAAEAS